MASTIFLCDTASGSIDAKKSSGSSVEENAKRYFIPFKPVQYGIEHCDGIQMVVI
jgi:hypothetical protein